MPNTAHSEPGPGRRLEAALSEHVGLHATLQPAVVAMTWGGPRKLPQRKGHPPPTACVRRTRAGERGGGGLLASPFAESLRGVVPALPSLHRSCLEGLECPSWTNPRGFLG